METQIEIKHFSDVFHGTIVRSGNISIGINPGPNLIADIDNAIETIRKSKEIKNAILFK